MIIGTNAGTGRNCSINQNRSHRCTCPAGKESIAHFRFIIAQKSFTTITHINPPFFAGFPDKLHHSPEFLIGQLKFGILGGTSYWENGKEPPTFHSQAYQEFLHLFQPDIAVFIDASHYIKNKIRFLRHYLDCLNSPFKALRISTHPVMICSKAIQADGCRMQSGIQQAIETLVRHIEPVSHHSPRKTTLINGTPALFQIIAHQRLSTGDYDKYLMRIVLRRHTIQHPEKIFLRHIGMSGYFLAIAATMAAMQVATEGTFPKELLQWVFFRTVIFQFTEYFKT